MSEKKNDAQPVEVDQAMGVAADEIDPGMSVMPEGPGLMDVPTVIPELDSVLAAMPAALPAYQTTDWKNKPSTETPIDAAAMTRIERRLVDLTNAANELRDSVSRTTVKYEVWAQIFEIEMPVESIAICLSAGYASRQSGEARQAYTCPHSPANYSGEKTTNGVKLKYAAGESAWAAIVVRIAFRRPDHHG